MNLDLDINEIKRYLKVHKDYNDTYLDKDINKAIALVKEYSKPKYLIQLFDISITNNDVSLKKTNLVFKSNTLTKHLTNANRVIILVSTLGLSLDNLIKKLEVNDIHMAYLVNGVAIEYLEKYIEYIINNILKDYLNKTTRYSIGFGDLALTYQKDLLNLVNASKKIGVNVTDTNLMIPSKSVSAIIGIERDDK